MSNAQELQAAAPENTQEDEFTKQQMLESKRFAPLQKDVLFALLADNETYTISKAELMIADFQKGEVE